MKNLTSLDLSFNGVITDNSVIELKNLTSLKLSCNNNITDKSIIELKKCQINNDNNSGITRYNIY